MPGLRFPQAARGALTAGLCAGALALASCGGGGGGDDLGPLWVPSDVQVADIDGDARPDVLTLAWVSDGYGTERGTLHVYRQTGAGVFAAPVVLSFGRTPWRIAIGDLNRDGAPDLVVTDPEGAGITWLLLQNAAQRGSFGAPQALFSGVTYAYDAALGDFNGDGALDAAVADCGRGALRIVVRHQDPLQPGVFGAPVDVAVPATACDLTAGDIDGDGRTDLLARIYTNAAATDPPTGALLPLFQRAGGGFDAGAPVALPAGVNTDRVAVADLNGDGRADLFAYNTPWSAGYAAQLTSALQGAAARTFGAAVNTSLAGVSGLDGSALADLNGDGRPDAAVAGFFPVGSPSTVRARVNLFWNTGGSAFAQAAAIDVALHVSRIAAADVNGDGRNDLVLLGGENACEAMFQSATPGVFLPPQPLR